MSNHRSHTVVRVLSASAAIVLLAGSTLAQERPRPNPSDALRGPAVTDRAMPRSERFGDSMMENRQRGEFANFRMLMASVKALGEQDNARLKLTEEQAQALTRIQNAYQGELREHMETTREQTQNLRKRVQEAVKGAGEDPQARERIMDRARAHAQEIRQNAPKTDRYEALVWEQLTPPQRRFVTAEMERMSDQAMQQRMEQRRQRAGEGARPGAERVRPADGPEGRPADRPQRPGAAERPARPVGPDALNNRAQSDRPADRQTDRPEAQQRRWAQLFQRIQRLSPQQQERLFNMINQTVERAESSSPDAAPARRGGEGRPERPAGDRPQRDGRSPGVGGGPRL